MDTRDLSSANSLAFEFHGDAWEYFRIWVVNVCLTLLTLGLYSPWAKVRQKRYLYGSTRLAESTFDYLANPVSILKGRLIAVALLALYGVATHFAPLSQPLFALAFVVALPWLIIRGHRFNAANTLYRNIRFDFNGQYGEAFFNFVIAPFILVPLSLGFAFPWMTRNQKKFLVDHGAYGNCSFGLEATISDFWSIYLKMTLGLMVGMGIMIIGVTTAGVPITVWMVQPLLLIVALITYVYQNVAMTNLIWNNTYLGGIPFYCHLRFSRMLFLYVTNILCIALSIGMLIPWAKIRTVRYRMENMGMHCRHEDLESFSAGQNQPVGAFGEELSDMLDVDIGL